MPSFRRRASVTDTDPRRGTTEDAGRHGGRCADAGRGGRGRGGRGRGDGRCGAREGPGDPAAPRGAGRRDPKPRLSAEADEPTPTRQRGGCRTADDEADLAAERDLPTTAEQMGRRGEAAPSGRRWGLVLKDRRDDTGGPLHGRADRGQRAHGDQHREGSRRTTAQRRVRRGRPAECRDADVVGLQQCPRRREAHHRQLDRPVQDGLRKPGGGFRQGRAGLEGDHRRHRHRRRRRVDDPGHRPSCWSRRPPASPIPAGAKQEPRAWRLSVRPAKRDGGQIKMAKVEFVP